MTVRSNIFWKTLESNKFEPDCLRYLVSKVAEGSVIIDVGAWLGPYTLLFSKLCKDSGHIFAFEPDPVAFKILADNIRKNNMANVQLERLCISEHIGQCRLSANHFGHSVSTTNDNSSSQDSHIDEAYVKTTTLDSYCQANSIHPTGIKIDVEGAETSVVAGAQSVLKRDCPWIFLEFHASFMPEGQRLKNWLDITRNAKKNHFPRGQWMSVCIWRYSFRYA